MKRMYDLPVSEPWYSYIKSGVKSVEGRKKSPTWDKLQKGDYLKIKNNGEWFYAEIVNITVYDGSVDNLGNYFKGESLERTLPGIKTLTEAKNVYMTPPVSWTEEEIKKYGVMALQLRVV